MYIIALVLTLLISTPGLHNQEKKQAKPDPVFARIQDIPGLPRVLLIGDSISMGYTLPVRKLLEGKAAVHRIPENGGPTSNGVAKLEKWLLVNGSRRWDVIHFNWGLHDLKITKEGHQISPAEYENNLRQLVKLLKATKARLIWASTTPVPGITTNPSRNNDDVLQYNAIALKVMNDEGIAVNDLYTGALPNLKAWQRPANVHFTDAGSKALAELVAKAIQSKLPANTTK